ncbi:hypothetical protein Cgig2_007012 [Carnegiea gigantea]|uniref:Uncharacterized protein n=1 Tax=Carnegiea gigantea TaxID=171969 RepID=A0A9Q1KAR1_9CARY|nr:hypothetical protein Cgig2_007012 [Carnegiea gigantea]
MAWSMSPPNQISAVGLDTGSLFISSSSSSFPSLLYLSNSPYCSSSSSSSYSTIASLSFKTGSVQPWILPFYKTPLSSSTQLVCRASEYQFPDPIPEFAYAETEKFRAHLMKKLSKKGIYGDSLEEVVNVCTESCQLASTWCHLNHLPKRKAQNSVLGHPQWWKSEVVIGLGAGQLRSPPHPPTLASVEELKCQCVLPLSILCVLNGYVRLNGRFWTSQIFSNFLHTEYGGPGTLLVIPFMDMAEAVTERGLPGGRQAARAAVKWAQDHVDKDWKEWTGGSGSSSK